MPSHDDYRAVIDLTHSLDDHSPNWEGTEKSPFEAYELGNIDRDGYYSRIFSTQEHYGTHLDAPAHFAKGMWSKFRRSGWCARLWCWMFAPR